MKKKRQKLAACFIAAVMALSCIPLTALASSADESAAIVVTAVGDSIGRGYGNADVVDNTEMPSEYAYGAVFSRLLAEKTGSTVVFRNYSVDGNRASHVMAEIESNDVVYDQNGIGIADAIRVSDVLLVSLGGNEIFNGLVNDWLITMLNAETIDDVLPGIEDGSITIGDILSKLVLPLLAIHKESDTSAELREILEMNLESTYQTYSAMLEEFFALNPDMCIILNGIPNPLLEDTVDEDAYELLNGPLTYVVDKYNDILIRLAEENSDRVLYSDSNSLFAAYDGEGSPSRFKINLSEILSLLLNGGFNNEAGEFDTELLSAYFTDTDKFNYDPHPSEIGHQLMAENTLKIYKSFIGILEEEAGDDGNASVSVSAESGAAAETSSASADMTSPKTGKDGDIAICAAVMLCAGAAVVLVLGSLKKRCANHHNIVKI